MNRDVRTLEFIESLGLPMPDHLLEIRDSAVERDIPVIRPQMMELIKTILMMHKPMTVLEIGTAIGFSALYMREYAPPGCRITTMENYPPRIAEAEENFAKYDKSGQITFIKDDAGKVLPELDPAYDMIFVDGPKAQYVNMYDDMKRLLAPGGVLLSDNVFMDGDILESRYAIIRRDRTIHMRMREYLYMLTHDEDYTTSILDIADGVAVSVKKT